MSLITLFNTIYGSYNTISIIFYLYLSYSQQKNFSFNRINGSQTNHTCLKASLYLYLVTYRKQSSEGVSEKQDSTSFPKKMEQWLKRLGLAFNEIIIHLNKVLMEKNN